MANSVFKIENGLTVVGGDSTFGNTTTTGAFLGPVTIAGTLNVTGLTTFTGGTTSSGNTVSTANFLPSTDGLSLGNTINRWQGNFVNVISYGTGGFVPSTNAIGQVLGSTTQRWVLNANTINATGLSTLTGSTISGTTNVAVFNATSANVTGLTGLAGGLIVTGLANTTSGLVVTGLANLTSGLIVSGGIANLAGSVTTGTANVAVFNATSANVTGLTGLAGLVTSGQANIATTLNVGVFGTTNGVVITNTSILVGNSIANALHNYNLISVANVTGISNLSPGILNIGTTTVNGTFINVGTLLATSVANISGTLSVTGAANALSTFGVRGNTVFAGNVTIGTAGLFLDTTSSRTSIGSLTNPPGTTLYVEGSVQANGPANAMTTFGIGGLTTAAGGLTVTGQANVSTTLNVGFFGTTNGTAITNTSILVGNSTANALLNYNLISVANSSVGSIANLSPGILRIGSTTVNGTNINVSTFNATSTVNAAGLTGLAGGLIVSAGLSNITSGLIVGGTTNVATFNVTSTANVAGLTGLAGGLVVAGITNVATFNATGLANVSAGLNVTGTTNVSVALNIAGGTGTTNGVNLNNSTLTIGNSTVNSIFNASTLRLRADSDTYVAFGNSSSGQLNFYIGAGAGAAADQWSINRGTGSGFLSNMAAFQNSGNSITFTANAISLNANSGSGIVSLTGLTNLNNGLVVTGTANVSVKLNAAAANITGPLVVTGGVTTLAGSTTSGTTNVVTFNTTGTANVATNLNVGPGGLALANGVTISNTQIAIGNSSMYSWLAPDYLRIRGTDPVVTHFPNATYYGNTAGILYFYTGFTADKWFVSRGTGSAHLSSGIEWNYSNNFMLFAGNTNYFQSNTVFAGTANVTGLTGLAGGLVVTGTANVSVKLNAGTANVTGLTGLAGGLVVTGGIANLAGSITTGTANVAIFNATGLSTLAGGLVVTGGIANLAGSITTGTANVAIFNATGLSTLAGSTISGTTNVSTFNATSVATLSGNTSLAAYTEKITAISVAAAGTFDLDLKVSSVFNIAYSSAGVTAANLRFINPPASGIAVSATVIIKYSGTPTGTIALQGNTAASLAGTLKYAYDSAPTLTRAAGRTDILSAITYDGGTTYIVSPAFMNFTTV